MCPNNVIIRMKLANFAQQPIFDKSCPAMNALHPMSLPKRKAYIIPVRLHIFQYHNFLQKCFPTSPRYNPQKINLTHDRIVF